MHAYDLIIDHGSAWKTVKSVAKLFPHLYRKASAAFIIKSVNSIDTSTFMVASQEKEILRILDFVSK